MTRPVSFITRLRLDAALYQPAPPREPRQMGRPRLKGQRLPTLTELLECPDTVWTEMSVDWYDGATRMVQAVSQTAVWYHTGKPPVPIRWVLVRDTLHQFQSQALLCTDPAIGPSQIIEWFVLRWQIEVTFQEARAHLGVETQRQWSDRAISRTTPLLLGLFSWITLAAHLLGGRRLTTPRSAAWYVKSTPTFVDAIALARRHLWFASQTFCTSSQKPHMREIPAPMLNRFIESLSYAA